VYHCDTVVGAVCCRREYDDVNSGKAKVYIMTLGVLKAYRKLGFGSKMLDYVLEQVKKDATVSYVYLHVQVNNQVAIEFYKKHGFQVIERIEDYYKKIEPHACFLLKYNVHV
jgi:ribosomal protein S18 acetylase RimI-like enzyme